PAARPQVCGSGISSQIAWKPIVGTISRWLPAKAEQNSIWMGRCAARTIIQAAFPPWEMAITIFSGRNNWKLHYSDADDFQGEMDEVRVWKTARSGEQIREHMWKTCPERSLIWSVSGTSTSRQIRDMTPRRVDTRESYSARPRPLTVCCPSPCFMG